MNKTIGSDKRLEWVTPQLRRIEAGSAEAVKSGGVLDGGPGPNDKS
jgi:hypothetical protein